MAGKRQIMSFYLHGDMPDLGRLQLGLINCDIHAIGPARIAVFEHADLSALCQRHSCIAAAVRRCLLVVGSVSRK